MFRFFEFITEVAGWIYIVASPLFIGLVAAAFIYFPNPSTFTLVLAILVILVFLVIGILWANRIWRTTGTVHLMSRIMATPELDPKEETETKSET